MCEKGNPTIIEVFRTSTGRNYLSNNRVQTSKFVNVEYTENAVAASGIIVIRNVNTSQNMMNQIETGRTFLNMFFLKILQELAVECNFSNVIFMICRSCFDTIVVLAIASTLLIIIVNYEN